MAAAPIVVYPPDEDGGRRVRLGDAVLGRAYSRADLLKFLTRAGIDLSNVNLDERRLIEWRGGGPDTWFGDDEGRPLPAQRGRPRQRRPPAPGTYTFLVRWFREEPERGA